MGDIKSHLCVDRQDPLEWEKLKLQEMGGTIAEVKTFEYARGGRCVHSNHVS